MMSQALWYHLMATEKNLEAYRDSKTMLTLFSALSLRHKEIIVI